MFTEVLLRLGSPDMETGVIIKWEKKEGAAVEKAEEIANVETDKAVVVVEAPCSGILHILAQEGEEVPVGNVIGAIYDSKDEYEKSLR